ncbi:hypothetical protein ACIA6T_20110 [Streptomyces sp. NPDC051740]|uniref:hypothetical protein n=1 Tax=Streptomyces sp. NPDC051740 TaxID=3365673 RepID=UPI003798F6BC
MAGGHRLSDAAEKALTVVGEPGTAVVPYSGGPGLEVVFGIDGAPDRGGARRAPAATPSVPP